MVAIKEQELRTEVDTTKEGANDLADTTKEGTNNGEVAKSSNK